MIRKSSLPKDRKVASAGYFRVKEKRENEKGDPFPFSTRDLSFQIKTFGLGESY